VTDDNHEHQVSSDKVFADLALPYSEGLLVKAALAQQIADTAAQRQLTQVAAAMMPGTTQATVSESLADRLTGFSEGRLARFLNALYRGMQIVVTPKPHGQKRATTQAGGSFTECTER